LRYYTVEATDEHEASRGLSETAELLVQCSAMSISGVSVCPLHAGIDSKLITAGLCDFHRRVAKGLYSCLIPTVTPYATRTSNPNANHGNLISKKPTQSCVSVIRGHCVEAAVRYI